jgi:hypothetical protein
MQGAMNDFATRVHWPEFWLETLPNAQRSLQFPAPLSSDALPLFSALIVGVLTGSTVALRAQDVTRTMLRAHANLFTLAVQSMVQFPLSPPATEAGLSILAELLQHQTLTHVNAAEAKLVVVQGLLRFPGHPRVSSTPAGCTFS